MRIKKLAAVVLATAALTGAGIAAASAAGAATAVEYAVTGIQGTGK